MFGGFNISIALKSALRKGRIITEIKIITKRTLTQVKQMYRAEAQLTAGSKQASSRQQAGNLHGEDPGPHSGGT